MITSTTRHSTPGHPSPGGYGLQFDNMTLLLLDPTLIDRFSSVVFKGEGQRITPLVSLWGSHTWIRDPRWSISS